MTLRTIYSFISDPSSPIIRGQYIIKRGEHMIKIEITIDRNNFHQSVATISHLVAGQFAVLLQQVGREIKFCDLLYRMEPQERTELGLYQSESHEWVGKLPDMLEANVNGLLGLAANIIGKSTRKVDQIVRLVG